MTEVILIMSIDRFVAAHQPEALSTVKNNLQKTELFCIITCVTYFCVLLKYLSVLVLTKIPPFLVAR